MPKENHLCMACMQSRDGFCGLHAPRKPTLEEAWAMTCEQLVQEGLFTRVDETTCALNLTNQE